MTINKVHNRIIPLWCMVSSLILMTGCHSTIQTDGLLQEDWLYPITLPEELLERVLLVAGEYHSGKTMEKFKTRIFEIGAKEIKTCVLYYQKGIKNQVNAPDYYGITKTADYLMPWQASSFLRTWKDGGDAKS